jgi:hypothetical protein
LLAPHADDEQQDGPLRDVPHHQRDRTPPGGIRLLCGELRLLQLDLRGNRRGDYLPGVALDFPHSDPLLYRGQAGVPGNSDQVIRLLGHKKTQGGVELALGAGRGSLDAPGLRTTVGLVVSKGVFDPPCILVQQQTMTFVDVVPSDLDGFVGGSGISGA